MATDTIVHAPAAGTTQAGNGTRELTLPRASDGKITMQLTTTHNWVELVYKAFGQTLPTGAKELALLGVREAVLSNKGAKLDPTSKGAAEGNAAEADYGKIARVESMATRTTWDDLLFAVWTDNDKEDSQQVDVYQCSIDPVTRGQGADATPYLLEGKLYKGYPSSHSEVKGNVALHLYTSSVGHIVLAREPTNKIRTFKTLANADTPRSSLGGSFARGQFVRDEDNDTIHVHFARKALNTSIGCTILAHMIDTDRYKKFMATFNAAPNKKQIPYLVVSSEYVRLYDDWVKMVDGKPNETPGPETVIMKDQLRSPKGMTGRYLPSIMTTEFANAIVDEAAKTKQGAVMNTSLERALFTVAG